MFHTGRGGGGAAKYPKGGGPIWHIDGKEEHAFSKGGRRFPPPEVSPDLKERAKGIQLWGGDPALMRKKGKSFPDLILNGKRKRCFTASGSAQRGEMAFVSEEEVTCSCQETILQVGTRPYPPVIQKREGLVAYTGSRGGGRSDSGEGCVTSTGGKKYPTTNLVVTSKRRRTYSHSAKGE